MDKSSRPESKRCADDGVDLARRRNIVTLTASAAGASLASSGALAQAASCALTENAGEGPFYFDPELMRADITEDSPGLPLEISIQVTHATDCRTLAAVRVDLWHANALGLYSGYEQQSGVGGISTDPAVGQQWLRGAQMTDGDGRVRFRTVYPSWYGGRTPHLHFKVWLGAEEVVASQIFFPDETSAFVFEGFEPYRTHVTKRVAFNDNDPLPQGVYCTVDSQDATGVRANAVVAITEPA
jgi:protocatechuate 3,4-dioxygenase beta subunit